MVFQLPPSELVFPDPRLADPDGLLAVGGDLSRERLLLAYNYGIFPWFDFRRKQIKWWCPQQRFVIFPSDIHVSHSMRQLIKSGRYRVTFDKAFDRVIRACSAVNNRIEEEGAWLGEDMIRAYSDLHQQGWACSVEVWETEELVGGLYGVITNRVFAGESMFSVVPSASKLALIVLARALQQMGDYIIDCQFETAHLRSMGGTFISYDDYMVHYAAESSGDVAHPL